MGDFLIIDAHVHCYQSAEIGKQALEGRGKTSFSGTVEEVLGVMAQAGIAKSVNVSVVPLAIMREAALEKLPKELSAQDRVRSEKEIDEKMLGRLKRRNDWVCQVGKEFPDVLPLITVDPIMGAQSMQEEVSQRVVKEGAKGIKLHPPSQRFYPADERMKPAYIAASELGVPVLFHSGHFAYDGHFSRPATFEPLLAAFPKLKVILAHLGADFWDESVNLTKKHKNVYFDCCGVISPLNDAGLSDGMFIDLLHRLGPERVLYGSDFPWHDPRLDIQRIFDLKISDDEKKLLLGANAQRIFSI